MRASTTEESVSGKYKAVGAYGDYAIYEKQIMDANENWWFFYYDTTRNGWEFHYGPWNNQEEARHLSTETNLFPKERIGELDYELLKKLGCTKERLDSADALF